MAPNGLCAAPNGAGAVPNGFVAPRPAAGMPSSVPLGTPFSIETVLENEAGGAGGPGAIGAMPSIVLFRPARGSMGGAAGAAAAGACPGNAAVVVSGAMPNMVPLNGCCCGPPP